MTGTITRRSGTQRGVYRPKLQRAHEIAEFTVVYGDTTLNKKFKLEWDQAKGQYKRTIIRLIALAGLLGLGALGLFSLNKTAYAVTPQTSSILAVVLFAIAAIVFYLFYKKKKKK